MATCPIHYHGVDKVETVEIDTTGPTQLVLSTRRALESEADGRRPRYIDLTPALRSVPNDATREQYERVYTELRTLALAFNVAVLTTAQSRRLPPTDNEPCL